ncbi:MAG: molybdenum cofactor guanylyltransferase [Candidatus Riflebacteria bacterium]|nr:molybdenum cofactor guanylyltransferase [Candidatus Riflebacteria bacterium]
MTDTNEKNCRLPIEALLLVGGQSIRMGRKKQFLSWQGFPMWLYVAKKLACFTQRVHIVGFPEGEKFPENDGFNFIEDRLCTGPLGGLMTGLDHVNTDYALLAGCDMPFISESAASFLLSISEKMDVVIPRTIGGLNPLFSLYSTNCLPATHKAISAGLFSIRSIFSEVSVKEYDARNSDMDWEKILFNINVPQDYNFAVDNSDSGSFNTRSVFFKYALSKSDLTGCIS